MNRLFETIPTSIFELMSMLAREHDAVNLGQGFPDFGWPEDVVDSAARALRTGSNQYPPMRGLPALRQAISLHYQRHQGLDVDVDDVIVTSGATEALAASLMALIAPDDEVVLIQPLYDAYLPLVRRAGGVARLARLEPPDWRLSEDMLREAITDRTSIVILNNPHNPTARVFSRAELDLLALACVRHDVTVISDEVWEHVLFDDHSHVPISSLPGMAERTVKVGSAGKIFSLTGWKVGWVVAPPRLCAPITRAHQFLAFVTPPNLQAAVAFGLGKQNAYFEVMRSRFQETRDAMATGLQSKGFSILPAEGTYFLCADLAGSGLEVDDSTFCERAVQEAGVAAIPMSAFYDARPARHLIRLCFAKQPETLSLGIERLGAARALFRG